MTAPLLLLQLLAGQVQLGSSPGTPGATVGASGGAPTAARSDHQHQAVRSLGKVGDTADLWVSGPVLLEPGAACTVTRGTDGTTGLTKFTINCTASGGTSHNILSATHTDTAGAGAEAAGDLVRRKSDNTVWERLPVGSSSQVLKGGTVPAYGSVATSELSGTISIAQGGTGVAAAGDDQVLVGNGTTFVATTLPQCSAAGYSLLYDQATNTFSCDTPVKPLPKIAGLPKLPCNPVRRTNCQ